MNSHLVMQNQLIFTSIASKLFEERDKTIPTVCRYLVLGTCLCMYVAITHLSSALQADVTRFFSILFSGLLNCVPYALTCQRAFYVLKYLRANVSCVLTYSRANVPYVLTCSRALRAYVLACQRALRAYVLMCSCANVPWVFTCLRVNLPYVVTYQCSSHAYVSACLACLRAYVI